MSIPEPAKVLNTMSSHQLDPITMIIYVFLFSFVIFS